MKCKWLRNLNSIHREIYIPWRDLVMLIFNSVIFITHIVAIGIDRSSSHTVNMQTQVNGYFSFAHYCDIPAHSFPAFSVLILLVKRNKLANITHNINTVCESLGISATSYNCKRWHCSFLLLLLLEFLYEFINEGYDMLVDLGVYTYYTLTFLKWLVVWNFANRFAVIRFYYGQVLELLEDLYNQCVEKEKLVICHELLGSCCTTLWDCYALQMTIFVIYSFLYSVFNIYLVVDSYSRSSTLMTYHYVYTFWTILFCSLNWLIVYSCAETKAMAKKFDKKLSQQIMNDVTNKLINNKRIMQHFKVKFKDFSGMGFFNFDYPLLFSMVSSATTYIVILVQFSGR
ncbi:Gustatory receptor 147a, partial [Halyomorpha halys]